MKTRWDPIANGTDESALILSLPRAFETPGRIVAAAVHLFATRDYDGVTILPLSLNHPWGALVYRFSKDGKSVAYITDTAPFARPGEGVAQIAMAVAQCRDGVAADTDGVDGAEEVAGAFIGPDTLARAWASGIRPRDSLDNNDGHGFFGALGDALITGPTLTNVNDFRAILLV